KVRSYPPTPRHKIMPDPKIESEIPGFRAARYICVGPAEREVSIAPKDSWTAINVAQFPSDRGNVGDQRVIERPPRVGVSGDEVINKRNIYGQKSGLQRKLQSVLVINVLVKISQFRMGAPAGTDTVIGRRARQLLIHRLLSDCAMAHKQERQSHI